MPYMTIYRLKADNLWHAGASVGDHAAAVHRGDVYRTACGEPLMRDLCHTWGVIGRSGGARDMPDPPREEVCPVCFPPPAPRERSI